MGLSVKSVVFFNNKGGVGKTTLVCNVASYISIHKSKRVLLIDADPQCNATQAMLSDEICEKIYLDRDPNLPTLFDYLAPIEAGEPAISKKIIPFLGTQNQFKTDLIPGHPKISLVEDKLSSAWNDMQAGTLAAYRITNWCSQLFENLESRYDLVIIDVGPSLGALNRTVLLSVDYLVTPFGCDIFSLLGIQNIASWLKNWQRQYTRSIANVKEDRPGEIENYPIITDSDTKFRFAGYSVQQYVTKTFKSGKRPVKAYDKILQEIPITVEVNLSFLKSRNLQTNDLELGHIPFLYSLVPLAQAHRYPIHELRKSGKLMGNQFKQVEDYQKIMNIFCDKLMQNIGIEQ
ncbi:AAA domain-containing protein [Nitrosomonas ureae]|uniref:AAA domain-containing protein n=1 Tax=Nitrosomonas ureae TaxID=44577 RepID=A0A285BVS5_9PROT|nr:AAA domain-containing protein [Nitrosomonas ureae]